MCCTLMTGEQTGCNLSCTPIQSLFSYMNFNETLFEWWSLFLKLLRVWVSFSCIHSDSSVALAELGRWVVTSPSIESLVCLILHLMYFSILRPIVNSSDMWKSHEEFRLLCISGYFSIVSVISSAAKLCINEFGMNIVSCKWYCSECF